MSACPRCRCSACCPGTGGLTRVVDKRHVRKDRADLFATKSEGYRGGTAVEWGLVDATVARNAWDETIAGRARAAADASHRPTGEGVALTPLRAHRGRRHDHLPARARPRSTATRRRVEHRPSPARPTRRPRRRRTRRAPPGTRSPSPARSTTSSCGCAPTSRSSAPGCCAPRATSTAVLAYDAQLRELAEAATGSAHEITQYLKRTLKRLDVTSRSLVAVIEPGSCFAGFLAELALAADRQYMLDGVYEDVDPDADPAVDRAHREQRRAAARWATGSPGWQSRFWGRDDDLEAAREHARRARSTPRPPTRLGLVTLALDDIDFEDELRIVLEERASLSPGRADRHGGQPPLRRPGDAGDQDLRPADRLAELDLRPAQRLRARTARCAATAAASAAATTTGGCELTDARFNAADVPGHAPRRGRRRRPDRRPRGSETADVRRARPSASAIVAAGLRALGLRRDDRVLLVMSDEIPMLTGILGASAPALVAVPVSTMFTGAELGTIVADSGARAVAGDPGVRRAPSARRVALAPEVEHVVLRRRRRRSRSPTASRLHAWDELARRRRAAGRHASAAADTGDDAWALWLYTSGTTGMPEGRDAPARQHPARLRDLRPRRCSASGPTTSRSRWPSCSSPTASATRCSSRSPWAPATVLEPRRPTPDVVAGSVLAAEQPTLFFAVPTFYAALREQRPARRRLRLGAAVRVGRRAAARRRCCSGSPTGSASRSSTASARPRRCTSSCPTGPATSGPGTTGVAVPGYDIEIARRRRRLVAARRAGRAVRPRRRRSRSATGAGPPPAAQVFQGEWLSTGDTYVRDADGYYTCLGRNSDMLKAGGIWVSPAEVESPAARAPGRRARPRSSACPTRTASTSRSPPSWSPTGRRPRRSWSPGAARAWPHFKAPRQVVFVDDLPKTATGKLQRFQVRGMVADESRRAGPATTTPEEAMEGSDPDALRDRQRLHRRQRQGLRRGVSGRLHLRGGAQELHQPQGVHRLRRLRAGLPGRGDHARTAGWPTATRASSRTTRRSSPRSCPAATRRSACPGGAAKVGDLGTDTELVRGWPDARRPRPGRRPRPRPGAGFARARLDRVGPRLRPGRASSRRSGTPTAGPVPARLDELFAEQGVDAALLFCEYSPKATGYQLFEDLLPIVEHNPRPVPAGGQREPAPALPDRRRAAPPARPGRRRAQAAPGARRVPLRRRAPSTRPTRCSRERGVPLVVHCGTSTLPRAR